MDADTKGRGPALLLVRHGQSTWNEARRIQGHSDEAVLTAIGIAEAERVARRLAQRRIAAIYTSDLRRAAETAGILARSLDLTTATDARLRERHLGVVQGCPLDSLTPELSGIEQGQVNDADARPPGGESIKDLYQRVTCFLLDLAPTNPRGDVVVVAHGGSIRVLQASLHHIAPTEMSWGVLENCAVLTEPWPTVPGTGSFSTSS